MLPPKKIHPHTHTHTNTCVFLLQGSVAVCKLSQNHWNLFASPGQGSLTFVNDLLQRLTPHRSHHGTPSKLFRSSVLKSSTNKMFRVLLLATIFAAPLLRRNELRQFVFLVSGLSVCSSLTDARLRAHCTHHCNHHCTHRCTHHCIHYCTHHPSISPVCSSTVIQ
jgi:hypothetical protein